MDILQVNALMRSGWAEVAGNSFLGMSALERRDRDAGQRYYEIVRESITRRAAWIDDRSYAVVFCARYLASCSRVWEAISCLQDGLDGARAFNRSGRLRMRLELALLLKPLDADKAWRLCRDVLDEAGLAGADALGRRARDILSDMT